MSVTALHGLQWILSGMLARGLAHASALVLMLVSARLLSPTELGLFVVANALLAFGLLFIYSGVYEYLLRADDAQLHANAAFSMLLATAVLLGSLMVGLAPLVARAFGGGDLCWLMQALAVVPLLACLSAWREALSLRDPVNMRRHHAVVVLRDLGSLALGLIGLWLGWGLVALLLWRLSAALIGWQAWRVLNPTRPGLDVRQAHWRDVSAYGAGITGTRLAKFAEVNGVDILLGLVLQPAAVGVYRLASRLVVGMLDLVAQPVARLNWVQSSEAARSGRHAEMGDGLWHRLLLVMVWPVMATVAFESDALTRHLLGARWAGTAPVLSGLAVAAMMRCCTFSLEPLFALRGQSARLMRLRATTAVLSMGSLALAPLGGMSAVVWGQVAAAGLGAALVVQAAHRHAGLNTMVWLAGFLRPALAVTVLGACVGLGADWRLVAVVAVLSVAVALWSMRSTLFRLLPRQAVAVNASLGLPR